MNSIRVIHNLPRSGGTIISKCISAQQDIILLSEIHPDGPEIRGKMGLDPNHGDPIYQVQKWYNLFNPSEYKSILKSDFDFLKKINVINEKVYSINKKLIIRDWSFIDFFAKPFKEPTYENTLIKYLDKQYKINSFYILRKPLELFLSCMRSLPSFPSNYKFDYFIEVYKKFFLIAKEDKIYTYEDFFSNTDKNLREMWLERFAIDEEDFLNVLLNKKLITILGKANVLRNSWRGHGGVVGDKEAERRSNALIDLLVEFRTLVGQKWKNYPLVTPQESKYSKGMHTYKCSLVMGVRTPFENINVKLKEPLEDGLLHSISPSSGNVLQLIPLVKIGNSPIKEKNACYFFNREEKKQVQRWVSFHYEDKPEILEENKLAEDFLDSLN